jgi:hypothetical protein
MNGSLVMLQHQNMLKQRQLEELQRTSRIRSNAVAELRYQESLLDTLVTVWQRKFICNACVDGVCRENPATCEKIHLIMSHDALKAELREAQKNKNLLASPQFAMIWVHAHEYDFRCLNLLKNIALHTGKYLWPEQDESVPVYPEWALIR